MYSDKRGTSRTYDAPSSRQARQTKPRAVDDTFMSVQVKFGRATSNFKVFASERTMSMLLSWKRTMGEGDPNLLTVAKAVVVSPR